MVNFYDSYNRYKSYSTPVLSDKIIRQFDREFWHPAKCSTSASVLEIGCGTGLFLSYLNHKKLENYIGIDADTELENYIPSDSRGHFKTLDILADDAWAALEQKFDHIVLFDVLEHFGPVVAVELLVKLSGILNPGGTIVLRLPNAGSPWGLTYQYGDLTHLAAYNPLSLRQLALAAGLECERCYDQISGSPKRRIMDKLLHKFLSAILFISHSNDAARNLVGKLSRYFKMSRS